MFDSLQSNVRAVVTFVLLTLNLVLWGTPVVIGGLIRAIVPIRRARRHIVLATAWFADMWVEGNSRVLDMMVGTKWEFDEIPGLKRDGRYLVIANHRSWIDIIVLFRMFHWKTPFIRFFLKRMLLWAPILGLGCWGLGFPFMRRYSPEYLAKHPEKRGEDLETTKRACKRYSYIPVTIANFLEGTRFSATKAEEQQSPYRNLLRPRFSGIAYVIASLGPQLDGMIDVTIAYPGHPDVQLWDLLSGRLPQIVVKARPVRIPDKFFFAQTIEPGPDREEFKAWIHEIWSDKDAQLESIQGPSAASAATESQALSAGGERP